MADMAPATPNNEARRIQMLRAAAELICERGFGETRIADIASRAHASSALVIYYFGSRERLLVDALRYSEQNFYDAARIILAKVPSAHERLSLLVRWTCVPENDDGVPGSWGLWFEVWAQALRNEQVKQDRVELDSRWRTMIVDVVKAGQANGEIAKVNARAFALTFSALLDGLSIQVALEDPELNQQKACRIAMAYAERELGLIPARRRRRTKGEAGSRSSAQR